MDQQPFAKLIAMAPTLGYWNIRGLAEQIRLLLHYLKVEYEEKMYKPGPAPEYDHLEWRADKFNLGLDLPTMPYYLDGDFKLTQSSAILAYIADEHDMIPDCKKQRAILHMLINDILDLRYSFGRMCYLGDFEKNKVGFLKTLPEQLKRYEDYLEDKEWLTGDKINYPDFSLGEFLNVLEKFEPTCLNDFPNLKTYLKNFENLPELKDYMKSEDFKTRDCNFISANWR